jgi:hypothetical protein
MADEKLSDKFYEASVRLAESNLDAKLSRLMRYCFQTAKEVARDVAEGKKPVDSLRQMDEFVREFYDDDSREMAEWEEIMRDFELSQDVVDDGK